MGFEPRAGVRTPPAVGGGVENAAFHAHDEGMTDLILERPAAVGPRPVDGVIADLRARFGERLSTVAGVREQHGKGEGLRTAALPDAVVFAESTEEVAAVVARCAASGVPIVPFGAGTSLEGHLQAIRGGITLNLTKMDKILDVSTPDLDCRVQAGVTREQLNAHLRDQGLFFPIDPGANATLGGMASTRASGTNAVRYGTMRDATLGLTVVTPSGQVIKTGGKARKSSAGYDLTRLYVGSEGTLGVITEVQLRLFGTPESIVAAVCQFDALEGAVEATALALQSGLGVARIELLDSLQMRACIRYSHLEGMEEKPTLFLEFHGTEAATGEMAGAMEEIASMCGGGAFRWARRPEERSVLWKARHEALYAAMALEPGKESFATDACVPLSRLVEAVTETRAECDASGLTCPIVGHVGDGNFHVLLLHDPNNAREMHAAETLATSIARRAIRLGGTCTGEHGIGLHKMSFMQEEHGPALDVMRALKRALDPQDIMNPGKTVPMLSPAA